MNPTPPDHSRPFAPLGTNALDQKQFVFVIGAPRSGTTWLHRMLADHPDVASLQDELTLFSSYLAPVEDRYNLEAEQLEKGNWSQGLPLLFSRDEFHQALRTLMVQVYGRVLDRNPQASHLMDKHPGYSLVIPLIDRFLPGSRFIHIIRDGREVALSMVRANQQAGFGANNLRSAAKEWVRHVEAAQEMGRVLGPTRYAEVRYESLMADPEPGLRDLFAFAGLVIAPDQVERIANEHKITTKQVSWGDASLNKLRNTPGAIWRAQMKLSDRQLFDVHAGTLLRTLGYAEPGWWADRSGDRLRLALLRAKQRMGLTLYRLQRL